ncbi:hypothetical protein TCAL_01235 [Tigriopus californicus]|uniref:Uncharacterized protein n=1 Tax=Tigriopus californicus TaxID=6832 RepID=A0A553NWW7_TIGCA|nr:hypothetical protein TCAL_01235 [Tigriopus californicus]
MTLEMSQFGSELGLGPGMVNGSNSHNSLQSGDSIVTSCSATVGGPSMVVSIPTNESRYEDDLLDDHVHSADDYEDHFEGLEVGNDHVPLGDILEKLEACSDAKSGLIRLHASAENGSPTISATVNVATLDLSDPESIHQHLSQLNDTVLKLDSHVDIGTTSNVSSLLSSLIDTSPSTMPPTPTTNLLPTAPCPPVTLSSLNPLPPQNQTSPSHPSVNTQSITKSPALARRTNSNGKPITQICSICSKAFSNASALAKHRLTHSEERRYQCNICSKAFKRQDHLNGHLLTHRSTKPFACMADGCGKSYCDARSLRRHKENHHSNLKELSSGPNAPNNQDNKADASTLNLSEYEPSGSNEENSLDQVSPGPVVKTKGLSPKQFQLIEQLIRDSKASSTKAAAALKPSISASSDNPGSAANHEASVTASTIAAKALAAVQSKAFQLTAMGSVPSTTPIGELAQTNPPSVPLPDKPVECAICQRKFKNIPALNGHMRLHGGYYKKDADGRRIIPQQPIVSQSHSTTLNNTATTNDNSTPSTSHLRPLLEEGMKKRKHEDSGKGVITACMGNDKLPPEAIKMLHQHNSSNQPPMKIPNLSTSTTASTPQLTITPATPSTPLPNLSFRSLPPPNTSQLLANLEIKAKERESFANPVTSGYGDYPSDVISMVTSASNVATSVQSLAVPVSNEKLIFPNRPVPMNSVSYTSSHLLNLSSNMATTVANALSSVMTSSTYGPSLISSPHIQRPPSPPLFRIPTQMLRVDTTLDKTPKVGPEHQADIPDLLHFEPEDLECEIMWDPAMGDRVDSHAMQSLLQLASSSLMPGASKNEETALKILQTNGGDVEASLQQLLSVDVLESESAWSESEVNSFYESLVHHHKNFSRIAREIGSKSVKDVVEFYYLWKNICRDESQSFKTIFSSTLNVSAQVNGKTGIPDGELSHNNNDNS